MQHHNEELQKLRSTFSDEQKRLNELNREQGASSWLTTIPLSEDGYDLTKWLDTHKITIQFSCKKGGFVSLGHNHIRNIVSIMLREVCKDVRVEPQLQQLMGENLQH